MLINLTPHKITIRTADGESQIPPSGMIVRLPSRTELLHNLEIQGGLRVPVVQQRYTVPELPPVQEGVFYIASSLVAQQAAAIGRRDVLAPDTGPESAIRDANGNIVAVSRLQTFAG